MLRKKLKIIIMSNNAFFAGKEFKYFEVGSLEFGPEKIVSIS